MGKIFAHDRYFPVTDSEQKLQEYHASHPEFDIEYITAHCAASRQETRRWLEREWGLYSPYAEPNFLDRLRYPGYFHDFSWQMYLGSLLKRKGYDLQVNSGVGPDLEIIVNGKKCWIEAITASLGRDYSVGSSRRHGSTKIYDQLDPVVARITNALTSKYEDYKAKYLNQICHADEPYIIAINGAELSSIYGARAIESAVFARGNDVYTKENGKWGPRQYELRPEIIVRKRKNDAVVEVPIRTDYFCSDSFKEISGVLYCEEHIINANNFGRAPESNLFFAINSYAPNQSQIRLGNIISRDSLGKIITRGCSPSSSQYLE